MAAVLRVRQRECELQFSAQASGQLAQRAFESLPVAQRSIPKITADCETSVAKARTCHGFSRPKADKARVTARSGSSATTSSASCTSARRCKSSSAAPAAISRKRLSALGSATARAARAAIIASVGLSGSWSARRAAMTKTRFQSPDLAKSSSPAHAEDAINTTTVRKTKRDHDGLPPAVVGVGRQFKNQGIQKTHSACPTVSVRNLIPRRQPTHHQLAKRAMNSAPSDPPTNA